MNRSLFYKAWHEADSQKNIKFQNILIDRQTFNVINLISRRPSRSWAGIKREAKKFGFKPSTYGYALIGKNFVVKTSGFCGKKPKKACPTYEIKNTGWILQPKLDLLADDFKESHWEVLVKNGWAKKEVNYTYNIPGFGEDAHEQNWGILNGEFVQHDW